MTWNNREEEYLKISYPSWTDISEIAKTLNKTEIAIMKKAHRMCLKRSRKYRNRKTSITMKTPICSVESKKPDNH